MLTESLQHTMCVNTAKFLCEQAAEGKSSAGQKSLGIDIEISSEVRVSHTLWGQVNGISSIGDLLESQSINVVPTPGTKGVTESGESL